MFPMALVCGNTFVIKPSEQDPGACMMLVEMAKEAGVPNGVVNVIHGQKEGSIRDSLVMSMCNSMYCVVNGYIVTFFVSTCSG